VVAGGGTNDPGGDSGETGKGICMSIIQKLNGVPPVENTVFYIITIDDYGKKFRADMQTFDYRYDGLRIDHLVIQLFDDYNKTAIGYDEYWPQADKGGTWWNVAGDEDPYKSVSNIAEISSNPYMWEKLKVLESAPGVKKGTATVAGKNCNTYSLDGTFWAVWNGFILKKEVSGMISEAVWVKEVPANAFTRTVIWKE
jgi:hypothetical protein